MKEFNDAIPAQKVKITSVTKLVDVTWKCKKGHSNFASQPYYKTLNGTNNDFHDICFTCGTFYSVKMPTLDPDMKEI